MQFRAFESGIEVLGQAVWAIVDGFLVSKQLPSQALVECGIGTLGPDGIVVIDPSAWYSQEAWLAAFERISTTVGPQVLFNIGKRIPENAVFPSWELDIDSAIRSLDVAYHLNHRREGQVMFDTDTGTMLEGIGHYGYERRSAHEDLIISRCQNPYPCDFDCGILTSMARRIKPLANVLHLAGLPCRKLGADSCTYHVVW